MTEAPPPFSLTSSELPYLSCVRFCTPLPPLLSVPPSSLSLISVHHEGRLAFKLMAFKFSDLPNTFASTDMETGYGL